MLTETLRQTETPAQLEGRGETLLVQTETPTQLLANPIDQVTRLIDGDVGYGTAAVHTHRDIRGDTEVLPDDVDSICSGSGCDEGMESRSGSREKHLLDANKQFPSALVVELGSRIPGQFSFGREAYQRNQVSRSFAECDNTPFNVSKLNPGELSRGQSCTELFDSDAITGEQKAEDLGHLEAVAESTPNDNQRPVEGFSDWRLKVVNINAGKAVESLLQSDEKFFGDKHFIGSEEPLDSNSMRGTAHQGIMSNTGVEECRSEKSLMILEPELHDTTAECGPGQNIPPTQTPKASSAVIRHSPCMSTSRSRSRSIALVRAASLQASELSAAPQNISMGSARDNLVDKDNSDAKKALVELKGGNDHTEMYSLSEHAGIHLINESRMIGHAARDEKCELKGQSRPWGQNVRMLFSEVDKTSEPEQLTAFKKEKSRDSAVVDALQVANSGICNASETSVKGKQDLEEQSRNLNQQGSLPSGFMSASTTLSYMESQEPGEESQMNALNVIDKVVWLNTAGVSDDVEPNRIMEQPCVKGFQTGQAIQCLAHAAQIKSMQDKMGVYDWTDSQQDEDELSSGGKEVLGPCKMPKKLVRAPKLIKNRKRLNGSEQHRVKSAFHARDRSDNNDSKGKGMSSLIGWAPASNMQFPAEIEDTVNKTLNAQTLRSEQATTVTDVRSKQPQHKKNVYGLRDLPIQHGEQKKTIKESSRFIEHGVTNCIHNLHVDHSKKRKLWDESENSHKDKRQSLRASAVGVDTQISIEAMAESRHGPVTFEVLTQRKRKKQNQVATHEAGERSVFEDVTVEQLKKRQRSSKPRESTIISRLKGRKRVGLAAIFEEHGQCNTEKEWDKLKDEFVRTGSRPRAQAEGGADRNMEDLGSGMPAANNDSTQGNFKRCCKPQNEKSDKRSLSLKELMVAKADIVGLNKWSVREEVLDKIKVPLPHQKSTINMVQQDAVTEVDGRLKANIDSSGESGVLLNSQKPENNNNRKSHAADKIASDSLKTHEVQIQNSPRKLRRHGFNIQERSHDLRNSRTEELGGVKNAIKNNITQGNSKRRLISQKAKSDKMSFLLKRIIVPETHILDLDKWNVRDEGLTLRKGPMTRQKLSMAQQAMVNEGLIMRKRPMTRQQSLIKQVVVCEAGRGLIPSFRSSAEVLFVKRKEESCLVELRNSQQCGKNHDRESGGADGIVQESLKAHEMKTRKHGLNNQERLPHDGLNSPISRRTRSSLSASRSRETPTGGLHDNQGGMVRSSPDLLIPPMQMDQHQNDSYRDRHVEVPAERMLKTGQCKIVSQNRRITRFHNCISPTIDERRRRKREPGGVHVLFSHGLDEDTTRCQKKVLAKLGGHVASSAADCTHFVADCFVRTRNMLESIAAGKAVVTSLWLKSCGQANYFIDEKNYILQDVKKEKELGFSMHLSLAAARCKPVLQGMKVLVSPNTTPSFEALKAIIESSRGQAVRKVLRFLKMDAAENNSDSFVVASEKDREFCLPLLQRGFKVYSTEFILNGIVSQHLDFSRNQLFEEYIQHKRPSRHAIKCQV